MNEEELAALLSRHAETHSVPGAALGILRQGAVTTAHCGVTDVTTGVPVTVETQFSTGSLTKSMVATVVAQLAGAGKLSLDDPAAAHVPELKGSDWAERATVRDLLANRSGLPLSSDLEFGFDTRIDAAISGLVAEVALQASPGPYWSYSNLGWCVLGRVIETVTSSTWDEAMHDLLLGPAGMSQTVCATDARTSQRVSGHEMTEKGPMPVEPLVARAYGPAGTAVISTAADLLRFAAMHLDESQYEVMRTVHSETTIHGWLDSWCLGWARFDWNGSAVWGWDGLINGERSFLRIMPELRAAVVLMTNSSTGRAMYRSLFSDLMPAATGIHMPPLQLSPSPGAAGDLSRYAGVYAWPDARVEVGVAGDSLVVIDEDGTKTEALPIDDRTFLVDATDPDNPTVTFGAFDAGGRPHVIYRMVWGLPRTVSSA